MVKRTIPDGLPPLSVEKLEELERIEGKLRLALSNCVTGLHSSIFDNLRALEWLRSYVVVIFDFYHDFHTRVPGYKPDWERQFKIDAVERTMSCFLMECSVDEDSLESFAGETIKAVDAHIEQVKRLANVVIEKILTPPANAPTLVDKTKAIDPNNRRALRDAYRANFPDSGIMDICWAAKQHYREWTRWLNAELKDGSKPDRAFRQVLTSVKDAKLLRREIRPKNWK